ncbi:MAG: hypothetical protein ACREGB_05245 [Candidatus Saccharimonadales bacterium]
MTEKLTLRQVDTESQRIHDGYKQVEGWTQAAEQDFEKRVAKATPLDLELGKVNKAGEWLDETNAMRNTHLKMAAEHYQANAGAYHELGMIAAHMDGAEIQTSEDKRIQNPELAYDVANESMVQGKQELLQQTQENADHFTSRGGNPELAAQEVAEAQAAVNQAIEAAVPLHEQQ